MGLTYIQDPHYRCRSMQERTGFYQRHSGEAIENDKPGEVIQVKKPPVTYSFKVLQAIEKRIGAKLVPEILENVTTPEQYELLEMSKISGFVDRTRGTGRPTKRTVAVWKSSLLLNISVTMTSTLNLISKKRVIS